VRQVQVDDIAAPFGRNQAERSGSQIAMWIDQHERASLFTGRAGVHEVLSQSQKQARLAATRLGDGEQVPAKQGVRQGNGGARDLVIRSPYATPTPRRL